jgi:hypothetical protein
VGHVGWSEIIESSKLQVFSNPSKIETPSRTLSGPTRVSPEFKISSQKPPTRFCLAQLDIVQNPQPLFRFWIRAQRLDSFESSIYTHPPPTALPSWPLHFPVEQAHIIHSKRPNSLSPRASIPNSCLGIEWSKDSSSMCDSPPQAHLGYWIFILCAYYSWSLTPRWLEVALELCFVWWAFGSLYYSLLW